MSSDETNLVIVKAVSMVIMFVMIMVLGNLPLRWQRFRTSTRLISLASGFSGGLFLAVGVLHLLPEAREAFDDYYTSQGIEDVDDEFPWSNFLCVICFAFVLFIEKVAFTSLMMGHEHEGDARQSHEEPGDHIHLPAGLKHNNHHSSDYFSVELKCLKGPTQKRVKLLPETQADPFVLNIDEKEDEIQKEAQTMAAPMFQLAQRASAHSQVEEERKFSKLTPYVLQVAIGIHAVFEGMAIGLETKFATCVGIALAVVCHKWAEGLTLGIAFFKADVELKMATIMITIQAIMNPVGIMIGWLLSNQGDIVRGIFESISAGTFLYIAAAEVIVNEFNLKRYRFLKFILFLCAIGFVVSLFFIEQATGA